VAERLDGYKRYFLFDVYCVPKKLVQQADIDNFDNDKFSRDFQVFHWHIL